MRGLCNEKAPFGACTDHAGLSGPLCGAEAEPLPLHGAYLLPRALSLLSSPLESRLPHRRVGYRIPSVV